MTDWAGNDPQAMLYYPWGQVWSNPGGNSLLQVYASLTLYDTVNNGYVPPFRYYVSNQGRWLTPDPLAGDITNPQSLNRYAYVLNNPTTLIDPLGLQGCPNVYQAPAQCSDYGAQYGGPWSGSVSSFGSPSASTNSAQPGQVSGGFNEFDAVAAALGAPTLLNSFGYAPVDPRYYVIFRWVPSTFAQKGGLISITTGYWDVTAVDQDTGFSLAGVGDFLKNFLKRVPWAGAITGSFPVAGPLVGLGPTIPFAYIPSTHQICGGLGVALTIPAFPGRAFNAGPLINGSLSNSQAILRHFSWSSGVQLSPAIGYQATWNSSGTLAGPTFGTPGAFVAASYSGCSNPR